MKIVKFVYLFIAYTILVILWPINKLAYWIFKAEMMFLYRWHNKVIKSLNRKIFNKLTNRVVKIAGINYNELNYQMDINKVKLWLTMPNDVIVRKLIIGDKEINVTKKEWNIINKWHKLKNETT